MPTPDDDQALFVRFQACGRHRGVRHALCQAQGCILSLSAPPVRQRCDRRGFVPAELAQAAGAGAVRPLPPSTRARRSAPICTHSGAITSSTPTIAGTRNRVPNRSMPTTRRSACPTRRTRHRRKRRASDRRNCPAVARAGAVAARAARGCRDVVARLVRCGNRRAHSSAAGHRSQSPKICDQAFAGTVGRAWADSGSAMTEHEERQHEAALGRRLRKALEASPGSPKDIDAVIRQWRAECREPRFAHGAFAGAGRLLAASFLLGALLSGAMFEWLPAPWPREPLVRPDRGRHARGEAGAARVPVESADPQVWYDYIEAARSTPEISSRRSVTCADSTSFIRTSSRRRDRRACSLVDPAWCLQCAGDGERVGSRTREGRARAARGSARVVRARKGGPGRWPIRRRARGVFPCCTSRRARIGG